MILTTQIKSDRQRVYFVWGKLLHIVRRRIKEQWKWLVNLLISDSDVPLNNAKIPLRIKEKSLLGRGAYLAIEVMLSWIGAVCSRGAIEPPGTPIKLKAPSIGIATCKAVSAHKAHSLPTHQFTTHICLLFSTLFPFLTNKQKKSTPLIIPF